MSDALDALVAATECKDAALEVWQNAIRLAAANGCNMSQIARAAGISRTHVRRVLGP